PMNTEENSTTPAEAPAPERAEPTQDTNGDHAGAPAQDGQAAPAPDDPPPPRLRPERARSRRTGKSNRATTSATGSPACACRTTSATGGAARTAEART